MKVNKITITILALLLLGVVFRIFLTSNNNFIFNIDNARDMVDVREMVILKKPRLISHTSGLEGVFMGPAWYYLLTVPFFISGGDPYANILLMILLWVVGGYFLLKMLSRYGWLVMVAVGSIWTASNFIMLATLYAFNPNPVVLLMPFFIWSILLYLQKNLLTLSILIWFLAGLFFNFEIIFGIFVPIIIVAILLVTGKGNYLKTRNFWIGSLFFVLALLPQIIFDIKHQFNMSKAVFGYFSQSSGSFEILSRINLVFKTFREVLGGVLMNSQILQMIFYFLAGLLILNLKKYQTEKNYLPLVVFVIIAITFLGFVILPFDIGTWHIGGIASLYIILFGLGTHYLLERFKFIGKLMGFGIVLLVIIISINSLKEQSSFRNSNDVSVLRNEIAAIDYVYKEANGQNFKTYVYIPSVIDYPYQYLFWWYGQKKYGYLPLDYAYLPKKPEYISQKNRFSNGNNPVFKDLVFLIKEPDRIGQRHLWENSFKHLKLLNQTKLNGLEIEILSEKSD